MNQAPVEPESRTLTEAAAESESPMLHQPKRPPGWVVFLVIKGIRTGAVVNQAPVEPESRTLTEVAAESESPMLHHPRNFFCLPRQRGFLLICNSSAKIQKKMIIINKSKLEE